MLTTAAARTLAVMSITGIVALNIPAAVLHSPTADAQAAPTGCIDVLKEVFDPQGNRLTVAPGFTFRTDTNQQGVNDSTGFVRINNVPAGLRTVTETQMNGWTQVLVTPSGGQVFVAAGDHCSGIVFKNKQYLPNSSSSSSSQSSSSSSFRGNSNQHVTINSNSHTSVNVNIDAQSTNAVDIDQDNDGNGNQDANVDANANTDVDLTVDAQSANNIDVDQESNAGNTNQDADVNTDSDTDVNANIDAWSGNEIDVDQESDGTNSNQDVDVDSDSDTDVHADITATSENNTDIDQNADADMGFQQMNNFAAPAQMRVAQPETTNDVPASKTQSLFHKIMLKLRSSNGSIPQWTIDAVNNYGW